MKLPVKQSELQQHTAPKQTIHLVALVTEVGFVIALPLVILIPLAVWVDRRLGTLPLFIILAMFFSLTISAVSLTRKIKRLNKQP